MNFNGLVTGFTIATSITAAYPLSRQRLVIIFVVLLLMSLQTEWWIRVFPANKPETESRKLFRII
jgi:hypothetical protein